MVPEDLIHHQNGHVICYLKGISLLVTTMSLVLLYLTIQKKYESKNFYTYCFERLPNLTRSKVFNFFFLTAVLMAMFYFLTYGWLLGWLVVFNVPSTARSFRDGTPFTVPCKGLEARKIHLGIEPRAVAWQSITLPLRNASSASTSD